MTGTVSFQGLCYVDLIRKLVFFMKRYKKDLRSVICCYYGFIYDEKILIYSVLLRTWM